MPAVLAVPMARDLGIPTSWMFGAFSAALVLSALLGPAVGRAIDRRGGRSVLVISNLVLAAGLVLLAAAPGPAVMVAGWLVLGVGMAMGLYDAAFATLAGLYGRAARGRSPASRCSRALPARSAGRSRRSWRMASAGVAPAWAGRGCTCCSACR
ncbi:hypothetical protein ACFQU2_00730 [Siccirubricoccus deserti]